MRVLLVKPCWPYPKGKNDSTYNRIWPPLSLMYCAALLRRDGHAVEILDAHAARLSPAQVGEKAADFDAAFLTSSPLDRWQCPNIDEAPFIETAREITKQGVRTVVTGFHGTVHPEGTLERTGAEAVIRGEPEMTVRELCRGGRPDEVAGLTFRRGSGIVSNENRPPMDLAELPLPAYDLIRPERYVYEVLGGNFSLFELSRGCPHACGFCAKDVMYGKGVRRRPLEDVKRELDLAIGEHGVRSGYFMDLEFSIHAGVCDELCGFLSAKRRDFSWTCQMRADRVDGRRLAKMRKAGCRLIHLGAETGSDAGLDRIGKKTTLEEIKRGVSLIREAGIDALCFFLLGLPGESAEDMERTIRFSRELDPTYVSYHLPHPYPGTSLPGGDSLAPEARARIRTAFLGFYLRPSYAAGRLAKGDWGSIWRQFRLFRSYLR